MHFVPFFNIAINAKLSYTLHLLYGKKRRYYLLAVHKNIKKFLNSYDLLHAFSSIN